MKKTTTLKIGLFKQFINQGRLFFTPGVWAASLLLAAGLVSEIRAATLVQEFFLPLPEQQIYQTLSTIQTTGIGSMQNSIYSIVVAGYGTVVHCDQWEAGCEISIGRVFATQHDDSGISMKIQAASASQFAFFGRRFRLPGHALTVSANDSIACRGL